MYRWHACSQIGYKKGVTRALHCGSVADTLFEFETFVSGFCSTNLNLQGSAKITVSSFNQSTFGMVVSNGKTYQALPAIPLFIFPILQLNLTV